MVSAYDQQELAEKMINQIHKFNNVVRKVKDARYSSSLIYYEASYELLQLVSNVKVGFINEKELSEAAIRTFVIKAFSHCGQTPDLLYFIAKEFTIMFLAVNELTTAKFFTKIAKYSYQAIVANKFASPLFGKSAFSNETPDKVAFNHYMWELEYLEKMIITSLKMKRKDSIKSFKERNSLQKIHKIFGAERNDINFISNYKDARKIASDVFVLIEKTQKLRGQADDAALHDLNIAYFKGLAYVNKHYFASFIIIY